MSPTLRDANPGDVPFLADCNAAMAFETEHKRPDHRVLEAGSQAVFDDSRRGFYLVAECDGERAGCVMVTYEWSDWRNGDWWWLQSVYVVPAHRREGAFRALFAEVERRAHAAGAIGLRLYVERDNAGAQQTYRSLGMEEEPYRMLRRGYTRFD